MNDPRKVLNVNVSSLLSLKAELFRKKNEVNAAKATKPSAEQHAASRADLASVKCSNNKYKNEKKIPKAISKTANVKVYETEDYMQLEKSRRVLEAKSKFYDRMSRTGGSLNLDDNCLVLFNRKKQESDDKPTTPQNIDNSSDSESDVDALKHCTTGKEKENDSSDGGLDIEDDEDWVEFTDCLGRTRKCLRKDLSDAKRRDKELAASMPERLDQTKANWMIDNKPLARKNNGNESDTEYDDVDDGMIGPKPTESNCSFGLSTASVLEEQRANWERQEQENMEKRDVHYQDVFFDEARLHGVGYYAFSTDEEERRRQQKELEKVRAESIAEQKRKAELRSERDKLIDERVFSAKNRVRERSGLPPMTWEEYQIEKQQKQAEQDAKLKLLNEESDEDAIDKLENAKKLSQQQSVDAVEREEQRKQYIRPWDAKKVQSNIKSVDVAINKGKAESNDAIWRYKPERVLLTQEQWNEKQRAIRNPEFAPINEPKRKNFTSIPPPPPALAPQALPSATTISDDEQFTNFQTTKRERKLKRRNYTSNDEDNGNGEASKHDSNVNTDHAPLEPDSDYGKHCKTSNEDLSSSIDAGLRFLREISDKNKFGTKSSWVAKADY